MTEEDYNKEIDELVRLTLCQIKVFINRYELDNKPWDAIRKISWAVSKYNSKYDKLFREYKYPKIEPRKYEE